MFADWRSDSTFRNHVVLGIPDGRFRSFGDPYRRVLKNILFVQSVHQITTNVKRTSTVDVVVGVAYMLKWTNHRSAGVVT